MNQHEQKVKWKHDRNGVFSIKTAYKAIVKEEEVGDSTWQWIWKLNTMQRCKSFIWLAFHNRLLTNEERVQKGLGSDGICTWCRYGSESLIYILRDCPETKQLWTDVLGTSRRDRFFSSSLHEWLKRNIQNRGGVRKEGWNELFTTICWLLWRRRNERIFEDKVMSNDYLKARATSIINSLTNVRKKLARTNVNGYRIYDRSVRWEPPNLGWIKVNTDGAHSPWPWAGMGCGGILRGHTRAFITGFLYQSMEGDGLSAELWACMLGLKMA